MSLHTDSNSDGSYYYAHMKGDTYTSTCTCLFRSFRPQVVRNREHILDPPPPGLQYPADHNGGKGGATYISSKGKSWTTKQ